MNMSIFLHTHPPTPYPGGRAKDGILYEFPSISDIFHFIDHYNMGKTIGSLVVAPEGYYLIQPKNFSIKKIKYDVELEDEIFESMENENTDIQEKALIKFGADFDQEYYFQKIANSDEFVKMFDQMVNKYLGNQLKITLKHRVKDKLSGKWIIDKLYLPV